MRTIVILSTALLIIAGSCTGAKVPVTDTPDYYNYNEAGKGPELTISLIKGKAHNHPLYAIWAETTDGRFLQTIYVSESIGKGVFLHGDASSGKWLPGEIRRPAALPYWSHRRNIQAPDGLYIPTPETAIPDAYTGATPPKGFELTAWLDSVPPDQFYVYMEINQTWDWNEYWTNNKYPDDDEYKTSCQPALVYRTLVDLNDGTEFPMILFGRSHESGKDGKIYKDIETMTTALHIADEITVTLKK